MAHNFESRPWGSWHVLDEGEGYKVKRLEVRPQQRLSYQTHTYRAELWIVVSGTATCVIEGREVVAIAGDVVEIGVGVAHRITNMHDDELVIVEVQRGSYTGEDDICRLEDDYGRVGVEQFTG
jgi:mannose-6-phosphate isomerase-like protein (cupin superfamily)